MPSTSPKQAKFMQAAAHSPQFAKKAGVSQKVGKEFASADRAARTNGSAPRSADEHMAARKGQGLSHREVGAEFGKSKSTAHRKVSSMMQKGFTQEGSAR